MPIDWFALPGLRVSGTVVAEAPELPPDLAQVSRAIASRLEGEKAQDVSFNDHSVRFFGPPMFGTWGNWHVLLPIESGVISLETVGTMVRLRYRVGYTRLLLFSISAAVAAVLFFLGTPGAFGPPPLLILGFFVGGLFGINFLISWPRVHNFLRDALQEALAHSTEYSPGNRRAT